MTQRAPEVDAWIGRLPEHQRRQVSQLAHLIQDATDGLAEAVKWGRLTLTVNDNWHHWLCAISATKTQVKLTFHKGALLDDPDGSLEGDGRYLRHIEHDVAMGRPESVIRLVQEAVSHQTDMPDDGASLAPAALTRGRPTVGTRAEPPMSGSQGLAVRGVSVQPTVA